VAKILLALSKPHMDNSQLRNLDLEQNRELIQENALKVCGLAFTNENIAARVNAFGPLAFCTFLQLILTGPNIDLENEVVDT
jgi:hypothetical protein